MGDMHGDNQPLLMNEKRLADTPEEDNDLDTEQDVLLPVEATVVERRDKRRTVIIEPVMLLFVLASNANDIFIEQYTHFRLSQLHPILLNVTWNDGSSQCTGGSSNISYQIVEAVASVAAATSLYQIYLAIPNMITMVTTILYGAYSDIAGRRPILLLPSIFLAIKFTINSVVIFWNLHLDVLVFSSSIEPFGGGYFTLVLGVYAYLADTTPTEKLGIRMTIVDVIQSVSEFLSQIGLGFAIHGLGYFYTYIILAGIAILNLAYIIFFVPETIVQEKNKKFKFSGYLKSIWSAFSNREDQRHIKIGLLVTAFLIINLTLQSKDAIEILFVLQPPLCWGTVAIGIFKGAGSALQEIGGILGYKLFTRCKVSDIGIAAIGTLSTMIGSLMNAFADSVYWMVLVPLPALFLVLTQPMLRTCASVLFKEDEQGRVLSAFSAVASLCYMVSALIMNTIYQQTAYFMPGFVFLVAAGFSLLSYIVICVFMVFTRKRDIVEEKER